MKAGSLCGERSRFFGRNFFTRVSPTNQIRSGQNLTGRVTRRRTTTSRKLKKEVSCKYFGILFANFGNDVCLLLLVLKKNAKK